MNLNEKMWYNTVIVILIIQIAFTNLSINLAHKSSTTQHEALMTLFDSSSSHHDYIVKDMNRTNEIIDTLNTLTKDYNERYTNDSNVSR